MFVHADASMNITHYVHVKMTGHSNIKGTTYTLVTGSNIILIVYSIAMWEMGENPAFPHTKNINSS